MAIVDIEDEKKNQKGPLAFSVNTRALAGAVQAWVSQLVSPVAPPPSQFLPTPTPVMALPEEQKNEIEAILKTLLDASAGPRGRKRLLANMFLDLVDKEAWAEYYEVFV